MNTRSIIAIILISIMCASLFAQNFADLKTVLDAGGVPYIADDAEEVCVISLDGLEESDGKMIYIKLEGVNKEFVVARLTIIDGIDGTEYMGDVYRECLVFNHGTGLLKAQYDPKYGDIDITYEAWISTPPEDFVKGIQFLVEKADKLAAKIKKILK